MAIHEIDPSQYQQQLLTKQAYVAELFGDLNLPAPEVFTSAKSHYRMRAEFKIWHEGDCCYYAMQPQGDSRAAPILMTNFDVASNTIDSTMPVLLKLLNRTPEFKRRLFQIEFLSTQTKELLITFIYHRPLSEQWLTQAQSFIDQLKQLASEFTTRIDCIGRSRKKKFVLGRDYVEETLVIGNQQFTYQQVENSFTQPNAGVCEKMVTWACAKAQPLGGDLLELYCGNGNFTLPLSALIAFFPTPNNGAYSKPKPYCLELKADKS